MNFYLIFHHNLAFSSIPEEHYPYLIDSVYSHFLDLVEDGYPLSLEFTGETLEIINKLRPEYLERLYNAWAAGYCEVIGSSYSQAISPLIPAEVNRWNLKFGHEVYKKLLGRIPTIAYLNEQVYSESMPNLYKEFGVQAIIFDWMSAAQANNWPQDYRYQMVRHTPSNMTFLWSDSIAFQKFQRVIWGGINAEEWLFFIKNHQRQSLNLLGNKGHFCLYASDAEVFDYHPGKLTTCNIKSGHLNSIRTLLDRISGIDGMLLTLPGDILKEARHIPLINKITTASYPLRTKKQDKYNVIRWAVTGREAAKMNTQCFQLWHILQKLDKCDQQNLVISLRKELVSLWGSDFRTHTIDEKYEDFHNRMGKALADAKQIAVQPRSYALTVENSKTAHKAMASGLDIQNKIWRPIMDGDPDIKQEKKQLIVSTPDLTISLFKNRGLAVRSLCLNSDMPHPLIGTIPHGHFADISLGSDFYSGHLVLVTQEGRQYTDLSCEVKKIEFSKSTDGIAIRNPLPMELPGLSIIKTFRFNKNELCLIYDMYAKDLRPASLRLGIWTLRPEAFERDTLYYETHQGGEKSEKFLLGNTPVCQDTPVNPIVTAHHCLGNTTGIMRLGDKKKWLQIQTSADELYSVPLIHHEDALSWDHKPSFFNRVYYSICERDDVANVFWKGHLRISFRLTCGIGCRPS